ncbi:MAG TPA: 3-phosphoshikimate 1-carboxyvinyltransferase [Papillibacter sp.]|nr:3-phosphoshikimate 1-carboxyvinyltransferase [Papillibacter sp.]
MNILLNTPLRGGDVRAIASKSAAHRLLICAALADAPTRILCPETSEDILATARCLAALGADIEYNGGVFHVSPIPRPVIGKRTLDCGESGSTLRFMLPVAAALGAESEFILRGRLPQRPLSPLYEELVAHGCTLSPQGASPLTLSGQLQGGAFTISGNVSSQFITGLLLALSVLEEPSEIAVTGAVESGPYIDMTLRALEIFGAPSAVQNQVFYVNGRGAFRSPSEVTVEGDWSNAAFWLCAGALLPEDQEICVSGLNFGSPQGDRAILNFLRRFGANVRAEGDSVTISRGNLRGIDIDAADTPDLVPVLAVVAAGAEGVTTVTRAERLRDKESDRLRAVTEMLSILGADIRETRDGLVINGRPLLKGGTVSSFGDHRIAMAAAVASLICHGPVTIEGAEAVNKSYPGFFQDFAALGGTFEEV